MSNYPDDFKGLPEERYPLTEQEQDDINGARNTEKFLHDLPVLATNFIVVEARKHGLNMTGDDIAEFRAHLSDATMDSFAEGFERINELLHRR